MTRTEKWLLLGLMAVYAVIALVNLGSLRAPETFWKPSQAGERFVVDLGEAVRLDRVNSFAAVGDGELRVDLSLDGRQWTGEYTIERNGGNVFMWQTLPLDAEARYVRFIVAKTGVRLAELAFYAAGRPDEPLPVAGVSEETRGAATTGDVTALFDEQSTAVYRSSFMNSMYFDEIYHGRTAYEHLQKIEPYESTHPPLGKVIISAGVALFGMNAFGWRIAGAIVGILMIPLMYLFAKRLFGKSEYAFFASFLFTFDFMHFVQTRIATIDVYAVFFIIAMYAFMYRYYMTNAEDSLKKTLPPLALSGLMFGLGVAAKWISLYAGVGLAVLFFVKLGERYIDARSSTRAERNRFREESAIQILWCGLWFVAVPALIYVLSYIPFMMVPGPGHGLKDVLTYQLHMYNYHSDLVATHPFASNWYEWPTMEKPVWYYGAAELAEGKTSVIVALGNPAIWGWVAIAAVLLALWLGVRARDRRVFFLAVGLGSVYLPWVLVPRLTFIYHFFAAVPFIVLCITYVIMRALERPAATPAAKRWTRAGAIVYMAVVLLLFVMFYPVLSGAIVDREYVETFLKWKDSWIF